MGMPEADCDGLPGPMTSGPEGAFAKLCIAVRLELRERKAAAAIHDSRNNNDTITVGLASSFADPADLRGFRRCKARGETDDVCFGEGDNCIGFAGHPYKTDTSREDIPYVALPPEKWVAKWKTAAEAVGRPVLVTINGVTKTCKLGDTMPHERHIHNGAVIDLAPGAQALFGLKPPFMVPVRWLWG